MNGRRSVDAKVAQIRDAAKTLFLREGFANVSTAALAKAAGVSKETLYSRYAGKEALLIDLLEELIFAGRPEARAVPELADLAELTDALNLFGRELAAQLTRREYVELARIVIAETPRIPHIGGVFRAAVPERALRGTQELLDSAKRAGILDDSLDSTAAARMFVGPIVVHMILNVLLVAPAEGAEPLAEFDHSGHTALFLNAVIPR